MFIIDWYKTKKLELTMKKIIYTELGRLLLEKEDILKLLGDLYSSMKDVPQAELADKFIEAIVKLVHNDSNSNEASE